jgi:hypothetical protein
MNAEARRARRRAITGGAVLMDPHCADAAWRHHLRWGAATRVSARLPWPAGVAVTDAYEFDDRVFHPRCVVEAMIARGHLSPAARARATEEALRPFVEANAATPADTEWLPRRVAVSADDPQVAERQCSGCDRAIALDVSVSLRSDPVERATAQAERPGPPTAREIADLLGDHRRMVEAAGGWASRIPREDVEAWMAHKADLLARIAEHNDVLREHDRGNTGLEWSL